MKHAQAGTPGVHAAAEKPRAIATHQKAATASQTSASTGTSREARIREAAYARYLARGGAHGQDVKDWVEAEAALAEGAPAAS